MKPKMEVPFFRASFGQAERDEVLAVMDSGWLTTGSRCLRFEQDMCAYLGRAHAISVNSCTAALHIACKATGLGAGDGVIVPTHTFAATAEATIYPGATPVLAEVDPITLNLDLDWMERLLEDPSIHPLAARGHHLPAIKAIIPVHYAGLMVDMERVAELARRHDLVVIEDAAHTLPAFRPAAGGGRVGVGDYSRVACLSFYATKNITTGEGGMMITDDYALAERAMVLRLHGLSKEAYKRYGKGGSWYVEILEPGFKYNMPDLNAALGVHQLARADDLWRRRRAAAARYRELLAGLPLSLPNGPEALVAMGGQEVEAGHSWHIYPVRLSPGARLGRDELIVSLGERGITCLVHWMPLHLHPYYGGLGYGRGDFPAAEAAFAGLLSLPFFPDITPEQQAYVAEQIRELLA